MVIQNQFSQISNEFAQRYSNFLEQLLAAYNRTILSKSLNVKSVISFKKDVDELNRQYLTREVGFVVSLYENLANSVEENTASLQVPVLEDEGWSTYLSANTDFLFEAIKLQSSKDTLYASNFMRTKAIELMSIDDHMKAYELLFNSRDLSFFYTDKIGRKVNSTKYIRTIVRDYLVKNYNDQLAGAAILNGIETVTISNLDEEHKDHGETISVSGDNGVNYFSIRNDVFHPNTNSIIRL